MVTMVGMLQWTISRKPQSPGSSETTRDSFDQYSLDWSKLRYSPHDFTIKLFTIHNSGGNIVTTLGIYY